MKEPVSMPYTEPTISDNVREYHIQTEATKLDITISPQFCSDGMSDFLYEYKVSLKFNGKSYFSIRFKKWRFFLKKAAPFYRPEFCFFRAILHLLNYKTTHGIQ